MSAIQNNSGDSFYCTEPPSACENIQVTARTATSINVTWSRPATTGRSDLFYTVLRTDPTSGEYIAVNNHLVDSEGEVTYEVSGLTPLTRYTLRVVAENGVSDQEPESTHLRQCDVSDMTTEGGML